MFLVLTGRNGTPVCCAVSHIAALTLNENGIETQIWTSGSENSFSVKEGIDDVLARCMRALERGV